MATTATNKKTTPGTPKVEAVNVLDTFEKRLLGASKILGKADQAAMFARVIFGSVLAAMFEAASDDLPALKADASKAAIREQRDSVRNRVLHYVAEKTDRQYSWSNVEAWIDAAVVNATLPKHLQVSLDGEMPVGTFGTFSLRALGWIEKIEDRVTVAEDLAKSGVTAQIPVETAVKGFLKIEDKAEKLTPKAKAAMVKTLKARVQSKQAKELGKATLLTEQIGDVEVALTLANFGRIVWGMTPGDPAIEDKDRRLVKRVQVFQMTMEQLLHIEENDEDPDDGIDDADAVQ